MIINPAPTPPAPINKPKPAPSMTTPKLLPPQVHALEPATTNITTTGNDDTAIDVAGKTEEQTSLGS